VSSRIVREQLASHHELDKFDSGEPNIDLWLRSHASTASARDYGRTYVWHFGDDVVVAFYTLTAHSFSRDELPKKLARGEQVVVPALLLGKFALDVSLQGQGLSRILIADVVTEAEKASQIAAARYLIVDALTAEMVEIYEKFGFHRSLRPIAHPNRLFARISDLAVQ
jgi:GNAT superfamily N-acetyltransferase